MTVALNPLKPARRFFFAVLALIVSISFPLVGAGAAHAQEPIEVKGAQLSEPVVPVRSIRPAQAAAQRRPLWQPGDPIREIPRREQGRDAPRVERSPRVQIGRDALAGLQSEAAANRGPVVNGFTTPVATFAGQGFTGSIPPDTVGGASSRHYVQAVNDFDGTSVQIWNLDGTPQISFLLADLAPEATSCRDDGGGDPNVVFDNLAGRWLLTEFTWTGDKLCIYVSTTSDATGSYWVYEFTAPDFPDYPKFAAWSDGYYAGTNENDPAVYVFDRAAMLKGDPATYQRLVIPFADQLSGFNFEMITPADMDGFQAPPVGSPAFFLRHNDDELHDPGSANATEDFVEVFELAVDWETPGNTTLTGPFSIALTEFDSDLCDSNADPGPPAISPFQCIVQPSPQRLDAVREVVMFPAQYRNFGSYETLLGTFSVDVDGTDVAASRWFELRRMGGAWSLHQEGTYGPDDGTSRWMSSIGMDREGNVALGYNVASGAGVFPGLRYTGRSAEAPLRVMDMPEVELKTGVAANTSQRYGDYTSMSLEPGGCHFWYTGEYNLSGIWSTWVASLVFDGCFDVIFADNFEDGTLDAWAGNGPGGVLIFSDDFETGDTTLWSAELP